jgi:MFS family permease
MSTIPRWFAERRGIAVGLTVTGFGLGGIVAPILTQWLISNYGWRQAYIALGLLIAIIIVPLAQFMKHSPQKMGLKPYGESRIVEDGSAMTSATTGPSVRQVLKAGRFWLFGLVQLCFLFSIQVIMAHIAPHAVDTGISATVAASIISIFAATSLIGRNLVGFISDKIGAGLALSAFLIILTASLIWLFFSQDTWMFYLFAVLYGIAYGGVVPLQTLVTGELFGLKSLGIILAILMLFSTMGGALGAPLAGYIFDTTGSYQMAFIICIVLCTLAIILSLVLLRQTRQAKHRLTA